MIEDRISVVPNEKAVISGLLKLGVSALVEELAPEPGGDCAFLGASPKGVDKRSIIGIERKRVDNLITSVRSGEFADQMRRMAEHYDIVILLIAGQLYEDIDGMSVYSISHGSRGTDYPFDALMNELQSWQDEGLRVQWCSDGGEARRILSLFHYYQRPDHTATTRGRMKKTKDTHLLTVPGVGPKRTEGVLKVLLQLPGAAPAVRSVLGNGEIAKRFFERAEHVASKRITKGVNNGR